MPKSAIFAIAMRDFAKDFKPPFRETRLLGHAPRLEKTSEQTNPPRDKRPPQEAHSGDKIAQDRQRIGGATTQ